MKNLAILGSTGSIGQSTLDVVRAHPDRLKVVALAAGSNADRLREQAAEFDVKVTALASATGSEGLIAVATHPDADIVICASAGTAALEAVLAAIHAGKDHRARKQRSAGHGRRAGDRCCAGARTWRFFPSTASTTRFINVCTAAGARRSGGLSSRRPVVHSGRCRLRRSRT